MSELPGQVRIPLAGWGNTPVVDCAAYRPERRRELTALFGPDGPCSLIARGLGRSYGDAALNPDGVVGSVRLNRLLDFDSKTGTLTAEAGVTIGELLDVFLPRGFFPAVTPGTKHVTLGGALAADVHGKNHHRDGSFAAFVDALLLLTPQGEVCRCSRSEHPERFFATAGGMGLTGVILELTLRLMPVETAHVTVTTRRARNLDHALELFATGDAQARYSVAWIDALATGRRLGRAVLMFGNQASRADLPPKLARKPLARRPRRPRTVPRLFPPWLLNRASLRAFNGHYYRSHPDRDHELVDCESYFYPLDGLADWNRLYGRRGFFQYQAAFPPETSHDGLRALLEAATAAKRGSFLAVLKAFGPASGGLLSFPRPGFTLALDVPNRRRAALPELWRTFERIVLQHGGRVYLAKDAVTTPAGFAAMYPRLPAFQAVQAALDPLGRMRSRLAERLGIVPPSTADAADSDARRTPGAAP